MRTEALSIALPVDANIQHLQLLVEQPTAQIGEWRADGLLSCPACNRASLTFGLHPSTSRRNRRMCLR